MSDFNNINQNPNRLQFGKSQHLKNKQPKQTNDGLETKVPSDPHASMKMEPGKMMNLLASQAQQGGKAQVEASQIGQQMARFAGGISPERHAQVSKQLRNAYQLEFGKPPSKGVLQELVDDYLIGRPQIQGAS